jgi:hypothetical protein
MQRVFRVAGTALGMIIMVAAAAGNADAQWGRRDDWGRQGSGRYDVRRIAFDNGYREGFEEGQRQLRDRKRFDPYNEGDFKDADNGYRGEFGNKDNYKRYYREGFLEGYERGYGSRGFGNNGNGRGRGGWERGSRDRDGDWRDGDWRDDRGGWGRGGFEAIRIARENGLRDGVRHGQEDRARRRNYDFDDSSDFRNATRGYRSEYGDRDTYRRAYREGFQRGYEEGYRRGGSGGGWTGGRGFPWPF